MNDFELNIQFMLAELLIYIVSEFLKNILGKCLSYLPQMKMELFRHCNHYTLIQELLVPIQ